jgi:hypothetical protein
MSIPFISTGAMCMVCLVADGRERFIDMGTLYKRENQIVLITSENLTTKYGHLVKVPIYIRKQNDN